ncbi:MAG: hypothetical protein IJQ12_05000 [Lachnospiraceae bacterium]|nr:hypothetical protein [Lachnospiraceae bacterium]
MPCRSPRSKCRQWKSRCRSLTQTVV